MYKILLTFLFSLSIICISAQITVDGSDMPGEGQSYELHQAAGFELDDPAMSSGADVNWDYSDLESLDVNVTNYVSVSDAPFTYQLIFNNPASPSYANLASPADNLGGGLGGDIGIEVDDLYNFFRTDDQGYHDCGFAASISGFPVFANRNPTDRLFLFPLEYGMPADTNSSNFEINIPELANVKSFQTRANSLDAWGSVTTPAGTYEALRVRSVVNGIDTVVAESFGINQVIVRPETIEYRWVAQGMGVPVLQINTVDGAVTQVTYRGDEVSSVSENELAEVEIEVFPNPTSNRVNVVVPEAEIIQSATLYDLSGRLTPLKFTQSANRVEAGVEQVASGLYRIVLQSDERHFSGWVVVRR